MMSRPKNGRHWNRARQAVVVWLGGMVENLTDAFCLEVLSNWWGDIHYNSLQHMTEVSTV